VLFGLLDRYVARSAASAAAPVNADPSTPVPDAIAAQADPGTAA
jgi:hypothetical protein